MYNVNVNQYVEIDHEEAGKLISQILKEDFDFISKEFNEMKKIREFSEVQLQDYNNSKEVRDAMNVLLRYYMVKSDYDEFMELQRCYGNVK